jgi:hypothetical protein
MKKRTAIYTGILSGLAAPASAFKSTPYPKLNGGDLTRLRGDVARIGSDFSKVIVREHGKAKSHKSK